MTAKEIEKVLIQNLADRAFPIYLRNYSNQGFSDADVFGVSNSGYMYEYEIKVSRSDFVADIKNKYCKHRLLKEKEAIHTFNKWKKGKITEETYDRIVIPNKFYYSCPVGLINKDDIPDYSGLIYIDENNKYIEIKSAPLLHHYKANEIIYKNVATILSQRNMWGCAYRSYKFKK
jgi:hypothetical protein